MSDVKWIKIVTDIFDDEKIRVIESMPEGDAMIVIWFKILCVAGKSNHNGMLMLTDELAYTEDMLSSVFNRDPRMIHLALTTFQRMGMIEIIENILFLPNWEKHQNAEQLEKIRTQSADRQRRFRDKKKNEALHSVTPALLLRDGNADVTQQNKNKNQEREEEKSTGEPGGKPPARARFVPPTIDEVDKHCRERGNNIDAEYFCAYYDARGWELTKGKKMTSWKSCIVTWEKRDKSTGNAASKKPASQPLYSPMMTRVEELLNDD